MKTQNVPKLIDRFEKLLETSDTREEFIFNSAVEGYPELYSSTCTKYLLALFFAPNLDRYSMKLRWRFEKYKPKIFEFFGGDGLDVVLEKSS